MLDSEENPGSPTEFPALEAQNLVTTNHGNNYISENNNNEQDVFNKITPLGINSTSGNGGFGNPNEWASSFGEERERDGGVGESFSERRATSCGFNAGSFSVPPINVARFRSGCSLSSPATRSPYITIPAGISPTELLHSPIMFPCPQEQLSPTTGTFQPSPLNRERIMLDSVTQSMDRKRGSDIDSIIRSQLLENHISIPSASSMGSKGFELPDEFPRGIVKNSKSELSTDFEDSSMKINHLAPRSCFEGDQQGSSCGSGPSKTLEDGYNWRKYGQKQVKGSEFPRSYYRCTHPNCLVKKKVEHFHDGEVAEIIYTGLHNHSALQSSPQLNVVGKSVNESHGEDIQPMVDSTNDQCENLHPFPSTKLISSGVHEMVGPSEPSCSFHCQDKDCTPLDGTSLDDSGYLNESESKRRKVEHPFSETRVASRGVREPRVVVRIESEIDILEDGYRWRKYGQKVVKGNPNPRSYYKCTCVGCPVRKHVERACDDYKCVITSYEGRHNHDVPVAKTTAVSGNNSSPATSSTQPTYALPRINSNALKLQTQLQNIPELGNDYMMPGFGLKGNLGSDMYPWLFPHLQNPTIAYGGGPNFQMPLFPGLQQPPMMMPGVIDLYNPGTPVQSSVEGQRLRENDLGLIKPKQENT